MTLSAVEQVRSVCAMGALQSVVAIPRAVPVLHAGPGCGSKLWNALASFNAYQGSGHMGGHSMPCTNTGENEVIFGGEQRLRDVLSNAFRVMDGDIYVVLTGCTADIVGDDVAGVVKDFRDQGRPVVYVETGGFKGSNLYGHELVLKSLIEQHVEPSAAREKDLVNLWSVVPYQDPFWAGNLEALASLVRAAGLKPNTIFGRDGGIDALRRVPKAGFNLLISPWVGHETVKALEERFGTPFFHYPALPIGPTETNRFLRNLAEYAGTDPGKVERFISREEARYYHYVERIADFLFESRSGQPTRFVTISDSLYSVAMSRFLTSDLGLTPDLQFVTDNPPDEYRPSIESSFQSVEGITAHVIFTDDGGVVGDTLRTRKFYTRPFVLGSTWDRVIAREINGYPLSVSMPVTDRVILSRTYVGYEGALRLLEDFLSTVLGDYQ